MTREGGFTVVETLVALCLLGVAGSVMVSPILQYSRNTTTVGLIQARNGLLTREAGRLLSMPYDSLAARAGCTAVSRPPLPHSRCVTVTTVSAQQKRLVLVLAPVASGVRPDTITIDRTRPAAGNPFSL